LKNTFPCCFCGVQDVPFKSSTPPGCQSLRSLSPSISRNSGNDVSIKKAFLKNTVLGEGGECVESKRNEATAAQRWEHQRGAGRSPHARVYLGLKAWHSFLGRIVSGVDTVSLSSRLTKPAFPPVALSVREQTASFL
jgi:hypothetical protein